MTFQSANWSGLVMVFAHFKPKESEVELFWDNKLGLKKRPSPLPPVSPPLTIATGPFCPDHRAN